jgi:hypothetical protein
LYFAAAMIHTSIRCFCLSGYNCYFYHLADERSLHSQQSSVLQLLQLNHIFPRCIIGALTSLLSLLFAAVETCLDCLKPGLVSATTQQHLNSGSY